MASGECSADCVRTDLQPDHVGGSGRAQRQSSYGRRQVPEPKDTPADTTQLRVGQSVRLLSPGCLGVPVFGATSRPFRRTVTRRIFSPLFSAFVNVGTRWRS
jgi:hypothetical protein